VRRCCRPIAAQATSRYLAHHAHGTPTTAITKAATTHGYTVAFTISAGVFLVAAALCGPIIRKHPSSTSELGRSGSGTAVSSAQPN
jgi:hypothetical protein